MSYLSDLNEAQLKPVLDTEGAVLVLAGAGSGKTRVLTTRIAYLIREKHVSPSNVLAITFTNKAANEMLSRVVEFVGDSAYSMWISTIHSMCVRILRAAVARLNGYDKNFTIYSDADKEHVLKRIIADLKIEGDGVLREAKRHISNAKNNDLSPERYLIECPERVRDLDTYVKIYALYEQALKKSNVMDFDDLILKTLHLLEDDEEVLSYYANKFRYVHIDEFQDTNYIQYRIAKLLSSVHKNIFVVGDDDQSIYGWRGAEIKNILNFDKDFKSTKVYKLEQNYRSTKQILSLANSIIANNTLRSKKVLWTDNPDGDRAEYHVADEESGEAEYVSAMIKNLVARGYSYRDFAVLMRINALSRSFEQDFTKYAIPFKVFGGFRFFERKEIKDVLSYLRLLINPLDDEAVIRIINTPKRGIGDKTINAVIDYAKRFEFSFFDALCEVDNIAGIGASAKNRLKDFKKTIAELSVLGETSQDLSDLINEVLLKTAFMSQFEIDTEENISKRMNIDESRNSVEEFVRLNKNATLSDYLESVTLSSDIDDADSSDYVSVATVHSVKGLEFKCVFIVGMDETIFPISRAVASPAEMEEE
ncbi:MAG: UvrD-helicase domain-containing protein, partial [Clostridia bacterium]|nr:UvrD-helicase domain-containing protein [Clostridia bacterium]